MALQEDSSEINTSPAPKKKILQSRIASLRNLFIFSKTLPLIAGLFLSYTFVELTVESILMDYLTDSRRKKDNQRMAAVVTNMKDGLSSIFLVVVSLITEAYTGCFIMITVCTAAHIVGLGLLWTSTKPSAFGAVYAGIFFLALGKSGQTLSESFFEYQLQEEIKAKEERELEVGSTRNKIKQYLVDKIRRNIWLLVPWIVLYSIAVSILFTYNGTYKDLFRDATLLMLVTLVLFVIGCRWYSHDELPAESNLRKIYRICKAAFGKCDSEYPTTEDGYYWKDYKQKHMYIKHGKGLRLLPRVPRLCRWLDKAAIVKAEESSETQEKNGKLCTVKDVREVKSLVPMMYIWFAFFGYSLLLATGNTFFVSQASSMRPFPAAQGNDISILFLIKAGGSGMSRFIYFLISFAYMSKSKRKAAAIIRIGFGMVCAVICSFIAWRVEVHRLSLPFIINEEGDLLRSGTTVALVPQFVLLGMADGLVDGGLESLFHCYVAKSMWSFEDSFSELVIGTGKLLMIPLVLIISSWFKDSVDTSHLDRFYLMLGILNAAFLLVFAYYSFRYAYKEGCPEDEKVTMEQTLEDNPHQPRAEDSYQENDNIEQLVDQGNN